MATIPAFRNVVRGLYQGEKWLPVVRSFLYDPKFKGFDIHVRGFETRLPDGWFHPSTHPLWPERMLQFYLSHPDQVLADPFDPTSTFAVTQGQFWHSLVEHVLNETGVWKAVEVPVQCDETGSRGHIDGISADEVGEFKTMRETKAMKLADGPPDHPDVVASFKKLVPVYYAQGQEYMRLSGIHRWRCLILSLEYPFPMREVAMGYDPLHNHDIREKYLRVRQAVADDQLLIPCCAPGSKEAKACPARNVCPVGLWR
jgi:hypothetical protein